MKQGGINQLNRTYRDFGIYIQNFRSSFKNMHIFDTCNHIFCLLTINETFMKTRSGLLILVLTAVLATLSPDADCQYRDHSQTATLVKSLATQYPALCTSRSLARTAGGKDIWLLTIGTGDRDNKPGIAVVGGIDGKYILGRELALGFAEKLLAGSGDKNTLDLLEKVTFYVFPDVSPDASAQYFSGLKYERSQNTRTTDEDRDFLYDEDPCEDLNGDGVITLLRVEDPAGKYIEYEEDNRVIVIAETEKGKVGRYSVFTEGTDNDKDGKFNEDGAGGVSFNRNLTYNYEQFGPNSGLYPVSEPETRAVVDFLYDRFNIYTVVAFGPQDNLAEPMKAREKPDNQPQQENVPQESDRMERGPMTSILKSDETVNKLVSDKYREITGLKGTPPAVKEPGSFTDWAYFHYGRYCFSTPGWWINVEKGKNAEAELLKFAENNKLEDVFVPWKEIVNPDFPDKKAEVGGIKPFVLLNPPADSVGSLIELHYKFIKEISAMHPELEFLDIKQENAGSNIFRLTLKVHNKGLFATTTEAGEPNIWTRVMRLSVEPSAGQTIISGQKVQRIGRLAGDESAEFSWLISGKGKVRIVAGAANTGQANTSVELR